MSYYSIVEIAEKIDKKPSIVEEWFIQMEDNSTHYVQRKNDVKFYDKDDLKIALFIDEKRASKWPYRKIFEQIKIDSLGRPFPTGQSSSIVNGTVDVISETNLVLSLDPESLFYHIAQDNLVIKVFKYHSLRVMYLASMLAKRVGCFRIQYL